MIGDPQSTRQIAILVALSVVAIYCAVALYAAWVMPRLQRHWLLRPRWRGGYKATKAGVTAQSAFGMSLSALGVAQLLNSPYLILFQIALGISLAYVFVAFFVDMAHPINKHR
jgi:hypothetical protein